MAQDKIKPAPLTDAIQSAKLSDMIKFFGPGAIIASLTIGSGETFFAARGGARERRRYLDPNSGTGASNISGTKTRDTPRRP